MSAFAPLVFHDAYFPIEDYGLIGDGTTAALCGQTAPLRGCTFPASTPPPLFCRLLDRDKGGGLLQIRDALTFQSGADLTEDTRTARGELIREVRVLHGRVSLQIEVEPKGGAEAAI